MILGNAILFSNVCSGDGCVSVGPRLNIFGKAKVGHTNALPEVPNKINGNKKVYYTEAVTNYQKDTHRCGYWFIIIMNNNTNKKVGQDVNGPVKSAREGNILKCTGGFSNRSWFRIPCQLES